MKNPSERNSQINPYSNNPPGVVFRRSVPIRVNGKTVLWRHTYDPALLEGSWFAVNGHTSVLKLLFDPPSFIILSNHPGLRPVLYDLGIPEDPTAIYYSWFLRGGDYSKAKGAAHKRAQRFTVECFGKLLDTGFGKDLDRQLFERSNRPVWSDKLIEDVGVWRTRVYQQSVADLGICAAHPMSAWSPEFPYLESKWDQSRDQEVLQMGGCESYAGCFSDLKEFFKRTANILTKSPVRFGRTPIDREEFREMAVEIHNRLWIETGEKPSRERVALEMGLNPNTFISRWGNTGGDWDRITKPRPELYPRLACNPVGSAYDSEFAYFSYFFISEKTPGTRGK